MISLYFSRVNCKVITGVNMWKFLVCFIVVLPAVLALNFSKCSKLPPPELIRTSYCKSLPCKLVRGQEIKADISFKNCKTVQSSNRFKFYYNISFSAIINHKAYSKSDRICFWNGEKSSTSRFTEECLWFNCRSWMSTRS